MIRTMRRHSFPHSIELVEKEVNQELIDHFKGQSKGFVQVGEEKWVLPFKYLLDSNYDILYNFDVRPDDTWIVTFPRSGTTVMQELVWMLGNNLNYEEANKTFLRKRVPFIEDSILVDEKVKNAVIAENANNPKNLKYINNAIAPMWEVLNSTKSPRFIKTHLPFSLLPPTLLSSGCKVIYVARNPKNVAVSFYYLNRLIRICGFVGDFAKFWDFFQRNLVYGGPYWSHVKEGWKLKDHPNVLFLFYEDIIKDMPAAITKISKFMGKSYTPEQINELAEFLKIENFKQRPSSNFSEIVQIGMTNPGEQSFIRKGRVGGIPDEFTPELNKIADEWIAENLKDTDLRFPV